MQRLALLVFLGLAVGCAAATPKPEAAETQLTSAEAPRCTANVVELDEAAVSAEGPYEVVGNIDLSRPSLYDRFGTEERVRHRACAMHADAAGRLASASGSGYVAVRRRRPAPSLMVPIKISDPDS